MNTHGIRTASLLIILAVTSPVMAQTPADGWSGQVQCTISVRGTGYQDDQVQTWTLSGAPAKRNDFRDYAATWTVTGSGTRAPVTVRSATALAPEGWTRTVNQADSAITIFVPVGTNTLRIAGGQRAQRAAGGIRGTSPWFSGDVDEWRFQYIDIAGGATQTRLSGSRSSPTRTDLVGWRQPSGASVTETCTWDLTKNGEGTAPSQVATLDRAAIRDRSLPSRASSQTAAAPSVVTISSPATPSASEPRVTLTGLPQLAVGQTGTFTLQSPDIGPYQRTTNYPDGQVVTDTTDVTTTFTFDSGRSDGKTITQVSHHSTSASPPRASMSASFSFQTAGTYTVSAKGQIVVRIVTTTAAPRLQGNTRVGTDYTTQERSNYYPRTVQIQVTVR